jgi:hypothetical protein
MKTALFSFLLASVSLSAVAAQLEKVEQSQAILKLEETLDVMVEASGAFDIFSDVDGLALIEKAGTSNVCTGFEKSIKTSEAVSILKQQIEATAYGTDAVNPNHLTQINNGLKDFKKLLTGDNVKVCELETSDAYYLNFFSVFFNEKTGYRFVVQYSTEN